MPAELNAPDFNKVAKGLLEDIVSYASVTGLNHIKQAFDDGGFTDEAFEAWPERKHSDSTRAIGVNTGNLRDSNRIDEKSIKEIVFANSAPYAGIFNSGGIINIAVTEKSRKFFWYMYYTNADKNGDILPGGSPTEASMWKAMALTKKSKISIKMKPRPFMKESRSLMRNLNDWVTAEIVKRFNKIKA